MTTLDDVALVALGLVPHIGGKVLKTLLDKFETPAAVLAASVSDLLAVSGIGSQIAGRIRQVDLNATRRKMDEWRAQRIRILTLVSPGYPAMLRPLSDKPAVLFALGNWDPSNDQTIAVVGTRRPAESATQFAQLVSIRLAQKGWTVVSGLARGIDTAAHQGALAVIPSGKTVAVLGSGVKHVYPSENGSLVQRILGNGAVFSEVAPDTAPSSPQLVARNRIITGLSQAVVVIETGTAGGAMHAARFALAQQRAIFVVDLPSTGNQGLIQEGMAAIGPDEDGIAILLEALAQKPN